MDSEHLTSLLRKSLDYSQAANAEAELKSVERKPGFALVLLRVVANGQLDLPTRLAGAVFFKNLIYRLWTDEEGNHLLSTDDVLMIKKEIIELMITLPRQLQAQIGESVSLIADSDFPARWEDLVPNLISRLSDDPKINNGVLTVAHSIFKRWRPLFRSDDLFREILLVLGQFCEPYLKLMVITDERIKSSGGDPDWLQTMNLLVKLYYDLNCQDVPEFFEDHLAQFMGILHSYLNYMPTVRQPNDDSDDEAGVVEDIKTGVCEILCLYAQKYEEGLNSQYVESCWTLLTTIGPQSKYDLLVNRGLAFLTGMVMNPRFTPMFANEEVLGQLVEKIIIPNIKIREIDEIQFEDEPMEYIRRDVEGSDSDTRRHAAASFLRELASRMEAEVTKVVMKHVHTYLSEYQRDPVNNWRYKNTATNLFSAIAAKGNVTAAGVSTTNLLIDIVGFFNTSLAPELSSAQGNRPILKADAVKFIYSFRNQFTKDQLRQALSPLCHLMAQSSESDLVVYTWASIALERILALRENRHQMFSEADIKPEFATLVTQIMRLISLHARTPELLAQNEFMIKCLMRVLSVGESCCTLVVQNLLPQLVQIVTAVSVNPSNPRFNHYLFESLAILIKNSSLNISVLDSEVIQPFLQVLSTDVTEFVPYILQILTEILALQSIEAPLPSAYEQLLKPLLSPVLWEPKGNVPALVGMLQAILMHGSSAVVAQGLIQPLLGVFQNLIASTVNDQYGLDLLEYILLFVPVAQISSFYSQIAQLLLVRLNNSRTAKFVSGFARFIYYLAATENQAPLGPGFVVEFIDQVQPNLFSQVLDSFILPYTLKINGISDRRIAIIGLTRLLFEAPEFITGRYASQWAPSLKVLVGLLKTDLAEEPAEFLQEIDLNELSFGSSFSRLQACSSKPIDPAPSVSNPRQFFDLQIRRFASVNSQALAAQLQQCDPETKSYIQNMGLNV